MKIQEVIIIGAGPAGLTAGYELLKDNNNKYKVTILEETSDIGGISKTVNYKGNRMDMGGHRFFSKIPEVNEWWNDILPEQTSPSYDDTLLNREVQLSKDGQHDPEKEDNVMLNRNRVSRIYFNKKFFDYPVTLKLDTLKNMGFITTVEVCLSYLKAIIFKRKENSLEDFYINRFGYKLYSMFFELYTENLWGRHPREISPDWGAQRAKGLSITAILKDILKKKFNNNKDIENNEVETSLIEQFKYPKLGPGQLWETAAEKIEALGGIIIKNSRATKIKLDTSNNVESVIYINTDTNEETTINCDILISSMPLKDLVNGMNNVPSKIREIAKGLPYRDYRTLGVLTKKLNITNKTKLKTISNIIPDCWIYIHDKSVSMGRMQVYNNWSPYLVKDIENTVWVGLEYFCNESNTDKIWSMTDEEFKDFAIKEMIQIGFIRDESDVIDTHSERVKKAYPAYFDSYKDIKMLISFLNRIPNLYCVGRNGQHHYNNMDHSMCTSFEAVKHIKENKGYKNDIWSVNTEKVYHESK